MYYSHSCTYCTKVFYTYHGRKEQAAEILYIGIKAHLIEYNEDHKEYELDDDPKVEINEMYYAMSEHSEPPTAAYELK